MKSKFSAAAALLLCAGAAHAQSSVTLYGTIDTGLLYQNTSAATFLPNAPNLGHVFQLKDGGIYASFWGIKGSEDIGGGYKINFKCRACSTARTGNLASPIHPASRPSSTSLQPSAHRDRLVRSTRAARSFR